MTQRHLLLIDIDDDPAAIARYEAWHAAGMLPPAIGASIRDAGIVAMDIYRSGSRLVMVMETNDDFDPAAKAATDAANAEVMAWEARMGAVQRPLPWASDHAKWTPAEPIFSLAQQP